jgi:hypothetical protein
MFVTALQLRQSDEARLFILLNNSKCPKTLDSFLYCTKVLNSAESLLITDKASAKPVKTVLKRLLKTVFEQQTSSDLFLVFSVDLS